MVGDEEKGYEFGGGCDKISLLDGVYIGHRSAGIICA